MPTTIDSLIRAMKSNGVRTLRPGALLMFVAFVSAHAQSGSSPSAATTADLEKQLQAISSVVTVMQEQLSQSQAEVKALRAQVEALSRPLNEPAAKGTSSSTDETIKQMQNAVSDLKDQDEVLQSEIAQHEQTKLESASKYPVKVTGLLLFSSWLNRDVVDNIDDPVLALAPAPMTALGTTKGSLAATARQSLFGLDATGPTLWGAKSSADVRIDFFGGLAYTDYNASAGIVRLRTAHARLDWQNHSLIAALDTPLISPLSPTSFVGVGEPALAWSGNLWTWSPQFEIKNRSRLRGSTLNYDFALMDPSAPGPASSGFRQPDASEQSRQPGYEFRTSYALALGGEPLEIGAGVYYSRQAYPARQHVDSWAGSADWLIPIGRRLELSGEFYRGRALGGLGGGGFKDVVTPAYGAVRGLDAEGGWAQLKLRLPASVEANAAFGQDSAFADELYDSAEGRKTDLYANLAKNRTMTGNIIFRPKTYLLFSTEFRYLQSWPVTGPARTAPVLGFAAGYLF